MSALYCAPHGLSVSPRIACQLRISTRVPRNVVGTSMSDKIIGDLSDRGRVEMRADLLAGSAGYRHFLEHLSGVISPKEAAEAYQRFATTRRLFWGALIVFAVAYVGINQLLGPHGL